MKHACSVSAPPPLLLVRGGGGCRPSVGHRPIATPRLAYSPRTHARLRCAAVGITDPVSAERAERSEGLACCRPVLYDARRRVLARKARRPRLRALLPARLYRQQPQIDRYR